MFRRILQLCNVRKFKFKRKLLTQVPTKWKKQKHNMKTQKKKKQTYKRKQQELYIYILAIRDEGWTANSNDVYKINMMMKSENQ